MSRNSKDLDKKLILVGQALIQDVGVSGVSLREVARLANVNLGMLNYYFNGKEDFLLQCLGDLYAPFIRELNEINIDSENYKSFEEFLLKLAVFSRDNRKLILILMKDVLTQEPVATRFIAENFSAHFKLIKSSLIKFLKFEKASQEKTDLAFRYLVSNIGLHNLMVGFKEILMNTNEKKIETNEELLERVHLTIKLLKSL